MTRNGLRHTACRHDLRKERMKEYVDLSIGSARGSHYSASRIDAGGSQHNLPLSESGKKGKLSEV